MISDSEIIAALKLVSGKYGKLHAEGVEQLFRTETSHFKSSNFLITLSPGMQATADKLPFGWSSLAQFWKTNADYAPTGIHLQKENNSALAKSIGIQKFMIFPTIEASMMSVAELIKLRGGNTGSWFSTSPVKQKEYSDYLKKIIPRFCRQI